MSSIEPTPGARISVSEEKIRAILAEFRLELLEDFAEKASVEVVTALSDRVTALELWRVAAETLGLPMSVVDLSSQIRTLQEERRLAEERVRVAATTLATETERRRAELEAFAASGDRKFSKRERVVGLAFTLLTAFLTYHFRNTLP